MKMEDVATWEGCFGRCFVKFALQKCKRNLRWSVSSFNIGSFLRIQHLEQRARWFLPDTDQIPCRSSVSQLSGLQKCIHVVKSSMRPMRSVGHAVDFATLKTSWWFFGWKQVPAKLYISFYGILSTQNGSTLARKPPGGWKCCPRGRAHLYIALGPPL